MKGFDNIMECTICGKRFCSRYSLNRHNKQLHKMEQDDYQSDEEEEQEDDSQQSDDKEDDSQQSEDETDQEDEEGEEKTAPFYRKGDRKTKGRVDVDEKEAMQYWHYMLQDTFGKDVVKKLFVNKSDEPWVMKRTREGVEELLEIADKIRDSPVYRKIAEEQARLEDCEYDGKEANKAAWFNRKFLVKNYLRKIIKEFEVEEEEDEEPAAPMITAKPAVPMITLPAAVSKAMDLSKILK